MLWRLGASLADRHACAWINKGCHHAEYAHISNPNSNSGSSSGALTGQIPLKYGEQRYRLGRGQNLGERYAQLERRLRGWIALGAEGQANSGSGSSVTLAEREDTERIVFRGIEIPQEPKPPGPEEAVEGYEVAIEGVRKGLRERGVREDEWAGVVPGRAAGHVVLDAFVQLERELAQKKAQKETRHHLRLNFCALSYTLSPGSYIATLDTLFLNTLSSMPRREAGSLGRPLTAITNSFEIAWSSKKVFHYHVEMWSDWLQQDKKKTSDAMDVTPPPGASSANPNDVGSAISKAKRTELIMRLQVEIRPDLFTPQGAFDGQANLFSTADYGFPSLNFEVPWNPPRNKDGQGHGNRGRGGGGAGGAGGVQRRPKIVRITVTKVNDIDRRYIQDLVTGDPSSIKPGSSAMMTLNMLNVFVQAAPRMQPRTLYNARSFYVPNQRAPEVSAFQIWRGYYQTVRPTFDRLIVTIDLTVGVVVPQKRLLDLFMSFTGFRDIRRLSEISKNDPMFRTLKLFAKQLKFTVDLPGHRGKKPKTIGDLVPDSGAVTFDKHGEEVSVADHFFRMHQVTIPPKTLGVKTKSGSIFPITVCQSVEQLYRGRSAPAVVSELMKVMPQSPRERLKSINESWDFLQYAQSAFMLQAGLSVGKNTVLVKGRLLEAPHVKFGGGPDGKGDIVQPRRKGVWDVMRRKFWRPAAVQAWTVVCFEPRAPPQAVEKFVDGLMAEMRGHGMEVVKPYAITTPRNGHGDVFRILNEEGTRANAKMLLVILPENAEDLRNAVKRFGDIVHGVATQCVRWTVRREKEIRDNKINQYHNNLILKINMRMGGINYIPRRDWFMDAPTMIFGADVSHPGPGSQQPSVAALVGSLDQWYTRYVATTRVQDPRLEMIEDLESMFEELLNRFYAFHKRYPSRIIFYRDGVSEGEFSQVKNVEVPRMAAVVKKKYGPEENKWPRLVFIVVGKRHHQRFFPRDDEGRDRSGNDNLYPGFVVDVDIVHPVFSDFYLQSQPGLKGTSRPTHYTVIITTGLNVDQLQEFTFHLCHCYLRATRSVKIPAPVYYADLVCSRSKFHINDNGSVSGESSSSDSFDLDMWKRNFSPMHQNLAPSMYWV
ncbi:hypothetical protein APHAL10511_008511 [Amanita phalloides]|nr:hypothetical protein APHAL10511_008511 [Amanita phalloides]